MPRALAISPHLDDAVFSAGGLLARLANSGWSVTIATIFTRSVADPTGFALACQLDKGLPSDADYMALRRAEDEKACALTGARPCWLAFAEAPHRGYGSAADLFGTIRQDDDIDASLTGALAALMRENDPDLVLAPQAIGGHVDHVQTVNALHRLPPRHTLWWRDFPYLARPAHAAPFAASMDLLEERVVAINSDAKHASCAAYVTQLGFQFGGEGGLAAALAAAGGIEKFRIERASLP